MNNLLTRNFTITNSGDVFVKLIAALFALNLGSISFCRSGWLGPSDSTTVPTSVRLYHIDTRPAEIEVLFSMKRLTTLFLTVTLLLGSTRSALALPKCEGSPLVGSFSDVAMVGEELRYRQKRAYSGRPRVFKPHYKATSEGQKKMQDIPAT